MISYKQFIAELRLLSATGEILIDAGDRDEDLRFRKWRFRLEDLIRHIKQQGYEITCKSARRSYGGGDYGYNEPSKDALNGLYKKELGDTLNEINFIIEYYDNYRKPPKRKVPHTPLEDGYIPTVGQILKTLRVHHFWSTLIVLVSLLSGPYYVGVLMERHVLSTQRATKEKQQQAPLAASKQTAKEKKEKTSTSEREEPVPLPAPGTADRQGTKASGP